MLKETNGEIDLKETETQSPPPTTTNTKTSTNNTTTQAEIDELVVYKIKKVKLPIYNSHFLK